MEPHDDIPPTPPDEPPAEPAHEGHDLVPVSRVEGHDADSENPDDVRMSLGEHLDELRKRIIYALLGVSVGMAVGMALGRPLLLLLEKPYYDAMALAGKNRAAALLKALTPMEAFNTYLRISVIFGLILAAWWIFYQLWKFVSVGLFPKERRYVMKTLPFVAGLFAAGAAFFLFVVARPILSALVELTAWLDVEMAVTLENHVAFMTNMMLVFGLTFQTPLLVVVLAKVGLVSIATFNRIRRHVVLAILIFTGIIAPPDAFSMLALAAPMWALYEIGVLLAWWLTRGKKAPGDREEDLRE